MKWVMWSPRRFGACIAALVVAIGLIGAVTRSPHKPPPVPVTTVEPTSTVSVP